MHFLLVLAAAILPSFQLHGAARTWRSESMLVRAVVDGDTISVASLGSVNLLGVTAPPLGKRAQSAAPFAIEARERLAALVLNRWVRLETDGEPIAKGSRHAAYVLTEDGQFVNAVLVREGLARASAGAGAARKDELDRAERDAQLARRGMWGAAPRIPSAGYTPPPNRRR